MRIRFLAIGVVLACGGPSREFSPVYVPAPESRVATAPDAGAAEVTAPSPPATGPADGHVHYLWQGHWYVFDVAARKTVDLSTTLDKLGQGKEAFVTPSPDGRSFVAISTRAVGKRCSLGDCMIVSDGTKNAEQLAVDGRPLHAEAAARPVIASGGNLVVYPAQYDRGIHLFATTRRARGWSAPQRITAGSKFKFHSDASIAADGKTIVFDCGNQPYSGAPSSLCQVGTAGENFQIVIESSGQERAHHPSYDPADGSIVFEGEWPGEAVYRIAKGRTGKASAVKLSRVENDNSPCVLPGGWIASLWLDRPGKTASDHELKLMRRDGSDGAVVIEGKDLTDVGIVCSR